jgi:hypothetical protein
MAASMGFSGVESTLVESSAVGSQLVQLGSCSEGEAVNKEVEGTMALEAATRQRLLKTAD